jgi:hypothetical protein
MRTIRLVSSRPGDAAMRRLTAIAPISADRTGGTSRYRQVVAARERLFEGLDGHTISGIGGTWRVRVYSICEEPGAWWLQLALEGKPEYTITVRTPLLETAPDTLGRLSHWLASPSQAKEVLTVA